MFQLVITCYCIGAEAIAILSDRVSHINVRTQFIVDDKTWPPEQPKSFTPLLFFHRQDHYIPDEAAEMAKMCTKWSAIKHAVVADQFAIQQAKLATDYHENFQEALDTSRTTKEIKEILAPLEKMGLTSCFILIESAPGIGKSVLLKEIACRWGKKQLLLKFELVLLVCLRDPFLQEVKSVDDLLQLFCIGDQNSTEIISTCSQYLFANSGKSLMLLLDGYDEYPEHLRENSLISNILKRRILPLCGLVVSSRPHASEHLRFQATIKVDILGFTETERRHYIKQALPDQPHKVKELTQYLDQQPSIDSICFIPFNMVILLYLYKLGISLPRNSTELYHHFICSTICRHLSKLGNPLVDDITDLTNLPEPYNRIIKQLSMLSLEAINKNKLIFTLDEIKTVCPDIITIPGAINGFGLLQAVQHFGLYTKTMTLNFVHFTVQEFLAAHYTSHLPPNEELKVIEENFWSDIHFNMFSIYMSLTKGQQPCFKKFLAGETKAVTIAAKFLTDQLKCFRLYYYFAKADDHAMCNIIEHAELFRDKHISLGPSTTCSIIMTPNDMECLSVFLASSFNKEWEGITIYSCYIQNVGFNILYHGLCNSSGISIDSLRLNSNALTTQSSSLISKFVVRYKVKTLSIGNNDTIGEDQQLYSMLTDPCTVLKELNMMRTKLSSVGAIALFEALKHNNKLKRLYLDWNNITDDASDAIITALKENKCLRKLQIGDNPLSGKAIINIVQCLEVNDTLQNLFCSKYPLDIQDKISSLQKKFNKKRQNQLCVNFW